MIVFGRLAGRALLAWLLASFVLSAIIPYQAWATPMVAITRPSNGQVVKAEVWVDAVYRSSSDKPIVRLELLVDGVVVRKYVLPTPRLKGEASFSYSFKTEAGELHRISVRAVDTTGATGEASINVKVKKVAAPGQKDVTPPVVNIYYPHEGQQVSGTCEIKVDARDNVGVEWVFIYLDGKIKAMIKGNPPYVDRWDTTKVSDGQHVLQARAWDAAENQGVSAKVSVSVVNRNRTLPPKSSASAGAPSPSAPSPQPVSPPQPVTPPTPVMSPPPAPSSAQQPASTVSAKPAPQPAPAPVEPAKQAPAPPAGPAVVSAPTAPSPTPRTKHVAAAPSAPPAPSAPSAPPAVEPVSPDTHPTASAATALPASGARVLAMRLAQPARMTARPPAAPTPLSSPAGSITPAPASAIDAARVASPQTEVSMAYRVGSPAAGLARSVLPPLLSAVRPPAQARSIALRPRPVSTDLSRPLTSTPPAPARAADSSPSVMPAATSKSAPPSPAAASTSHPAIDHPARRAMAPRPVRPARGAMPQPDLVPRAAEVYLLAMAPRPSPTLPGGQKTSTPGRSARKPCLINISPVALSRFSEVKVVYDGRVIPLRSCPEVRCGVPVGPLREIFEQCDGVLYWFPVQKRVKAVRPGLAMELKIGVPTVKVNGAAEELCLAPYIRRGRTMVPLEFLARTLNLTITFDSKRGQLIISRNDL